MKNKKKRSRKKSARISGKRFSVKTEVLKKYGIVAAGVTTGGVVCYFGEETLPENDYARGGIKAGAGIAGAVFLPGAYLKTTSATVAAYGGGILANIAAQKLGLYEGSVPFLPHTRQEHESFFGGSSDTDETADDGAGSDEEKVSGGGRSYNFRHNADGMAAGDVEVA